MKNLTDVKRASFINVQHCIEFRVLVNSPVEYSTGSHEEDSKCGVFTEISLGILKDAHGSILV
jgi:hypothetical protein